jgi:hypothetical protein
VRLDTRKGRPRASRLRFQAGDRIRVAARTLVVLSNDAI